MRNTTFCFGVLCVWLLGCISANAEVKMASPFSNGMVLQQSTKAKIWGTATPKSTVTLTASWDYKNVNVVANDKGHWTAWLSTPKGSFTPYAITISDGSNPVVVRDVLIGEVWLAGGQSNMEMPLQGWGKQKVTTGDKLIAGAQAYAGKIHVASVKTVYSQTPLDTASIEWKDSTPTTINNVTAIGYMFATNLVAKLQCPVGIIDCNRGGSSVEAWMPRDVLLNWSDVNLNDTIYKKMDEHTPCALYNGKLYPLRGYTMAGFLWYQGESNVGESRKFYTARFSAMVQRWRQDWGQGNLPFYFVQIAPYCYNGNQATCAAILREAQAEAYHKIANSGIVGTVDLVTPKEDKSIHPANKASVALRLANWALAEVYKQPNINHQHPEYKSHKIKNGRAYVNFSNSKNGFNRAVDITGFEMCGADSVYYTAHATSKNNQVIVSCDSVRNPTQVRYCFRNFLLGNLANKENLAILPFRTDKFEK